MLEFLDVFCGFWGVEKGIAHKEEIINSIKKIIDYQELNIIETGKNYFKKGILIFRFPRHSSPFLPKYLEHCSFVFSAVARAIIF